ncbi:Alpha/Beta hydrolase protein [Amanita rubescens]|nr:Alpha/Beta hydrolase protein [Amanita rubescens]
MAVFKSLLATVILVSLLALSQCNGVFAHSHSLRTDEVRARQFEAAKRYTIDNLLKAQQTSNSQSSAPATGIKNITFSNPLASQFYVDGSKIPLVHWDVGPSWAGLLPISDDPDETRKLFFWFFPPGPNGSLDDLIFWTNGGPGCSSMEGFLQENGPISWGYGQAHATQNQYSWTNLSSVLWVEQPVGTGFSQGTPTAQNEEDVASQLVGFLQQFLEVFSELKGKKFYLTGESYAGTYIPYIADYIYSNPSLLDLSLQGIWMGDPFISWFVVQEQIPAVDFVHKYNHVFSLNTTFMNQLDAMAKQCNYAGYVDEYVTFPPKGPLPFFWTNTTADPGCDVWDTILNATLIVNPAFNIYRIFDQYPILWDVLGFPGTFDNQQSPIYFNRTEVKEAIHAPVNVNWAECSNISVFPNGDASLPPVFTVLPNVIEKSKRSVIMHGLGDYVLIADGTRIAIQNMTWGGLQGFRTPIVPDSFIVDGIGALGNVHSERGLTYIEVVLSGHMLPQFTPWSAYQSMQYLLGFRPTP